MTRVGWFEGQIKCLQDDDDYYYYHYYADVILHFTRINNSHVNCQLPAPPLLIVFVKEGIIIILIVYSIGQMKRVSIDGGSSSSSSSVRVQILNGVLEEHTQIQPQIDGDDLLGSQPLHSPAGSGSD